MSKSQLLQSQKFVTVASAIQHQHYMQHHSIAASQHCSITALQHCSITASQHHSIAASQHHSITASQHCSIAASQHNSIIASRHHSITALHHLMTGAYVLYACMWHLSNTCKTKLEFHFQFNPITAVQLGCPRQAPALGSSTLIE